MQRYNYLDAQQKAYRKDSARLLQNNSNELLFSHSLYFSFANPRDGDSSKASFCQKSTAIFNTWQSQVPSANLRYLFVKNKFGCSKPQFFPWSFINSFLNMSYILY